MIGILWEKAAHEFWIITVVIGGLGAWLTGRALASTWRPLWLVVVYALPMGLAVRILHFVLADGALLSGYFLTLDTMFVMLVAIVSWRYTQTRVMVAQYPWLYERTSAFTWRAR